MPTSPACPPPLPRRPAAGKIACYQGGGGKTALLFIHGVGLSADCWHAQINPLQEQFSVYAADLPGHGQSPYFAGKYQNINDYAAEIADFIDTRIGQKVIVIGHSLGALIALALAAHHAGLVQAAAALNAVYQRSAAARQAVRERAARLKQEKDTEALIDSTVRRWFGHPPAAAQQAAAEACRRWLRATPVRAYAAAYEVFAGHCAAALPLRDIAVPALYLTGEQDMNSTAAMSRRMAAITPGARAVILPGHAHLTPLTAAAEVNHALRQWINNLPPPAAA